MLAAGCTTVIGGQLHRGFVQSASASLRSTPAGAGVSTLQQRSDIPEEQIWLDKEKSARPRRAYRLDVQHLMRTLSITTRAELRLADHKGVIARERFMRETEHAAASTIRRRLAGLSLKAPDPPRPRPAASRRRSPRRRRDTRLLEGAGAQDPQRAARR
jgi:hypothetical protein